MGENVVDLRPDAPTPGDLVDCGMETIINMPGLLFGVSAFSDLSGRTWQSRGGNMSDLTKDQLRDLASAVGILQREIIDEMRNRP